MNEALKTYVRPALVCLIFFTIIFSYFIFHYVNLDTFEILFPWTDTNYYSDLSRKINETGLEKTNLYFDEIKNIDKNIQFYIRFDPSRIENVP